MRSRFAYHAVLVIFVLSNCVATQGCAQHKADGRVDIVVTSASPDQEYVATVYTVSGGGAAGYIYRLVNLRRHGEPFDPEKGIIFQATRTQNITVTWRGGESLTISYSKPGSVLTKVEEWTGGRKIRIGYVEE